MGKHAAPRATSMKARQISRAAGVSAGTLLLCLGAAAPAMAGTSPLPTPPLSDVPTPPIPQPVTDAVQQVSDIVGVPNPIAPTATSSHHHHHHAKPGGEVTKPSISLHRHSATAPSTHRRTTRYVATPTSVPSPYYYGGGLVRPNATQGPAVMTGRAPAVADKPTVTRIVQSAGSRAIHALPSTATPEDAARLAVLAIATMLLGGLASGHLKLAQQRLSGW